MAWIDKQRNVIDFTLSSLLRRKGKNAALIIVYTAVVFVLASVMLFTHALKREADIILREAPEIVLQRMVAGRHDLMPASYATVVDKITGVSSVKPRLWGYYYDTLFRANYTLLVPDDFKYGKGDVIIGEGSESQGRIMLTKKLVEFRRTAEETDDRQGAYSIDVK